jgi:glycosyltransferase involved in cell wall biosynthesis
MRIIHFSHCDLGGTEASTAHVMEFAEGLARRGHRVCAVSPKKNKAYPYKTPCEMLYFPMINIKGLRQISAILTGFLTLLRLKISWKPDCLYSRRLVLDPMPGIFAWFTGTPLITETNGQIEVHKYEVPLHLLWKYFWYPLMRFFERIVFSNSFAVTADGKQRLGVFKNRYPNWGNRFHLVRSGGIDLQRFTRINKSEARKQLGLPMEKRLLVWVGTIFDFSGLEILFQAARNICMQLSDVEFLIIGDGSAKKQYIRMVNEKGLSHRIHFTGYIPNNELFLWLSACDIALAPYNRLRLGKEDFTSYKIFEYLACGLPVVCSYENGGSNISYINSYNLGATAPLENAEAFADAVLKVLEDKSYFSTDFEQRARAVLQDLNVTWDALVNRVESLCQSAADSNFCLK